ncbi:MAG: hypothetical protein WCL27_17215, partial [Betaproteobacteria bacterium]
RYRCLPNIPNFDPQVLDALLDLSKVLDYARRAISQLTITSAATVPQRDLWFQLKQAYAIDAASHKGLTY